MSGSLAITIGDPGGVGPEVTLKALASEWKSDRSRYLIIGDADLLLSLNLQLGLNLPLALEGPESSEKRIVICSPLKAFPDSNTLPKPSVDTARAAVAWLREGAHRCLNGDAQALITAPVCKESIIRSGQSFVGQTEFLAELAGESQVVMMLLGTDAQGRWLRVALATTHVPIRRVAQELTQKKVARAIELAEKACNDLGLKRKKIGVCGLNPHAGEGGALGNEEQLIIAPAIAAAQARGMDVTGPLPADTLFHFAYRGDYDAVVAMYHDQGLAPLKMVAFDSGVNWTLGLPFVRTSPDHGTAFDIAGKGIANPASMISAIRLAKQLSH